MAQLQISLDIFEALPRLEHALYLTSGGACSYRCPSCSHRRFPS